MQTPTRQLHTEKTEPSATWVMIVPGTTKLEILSSDTSRTATTTTASDRLHLSQLSHLTSFEEEGTSPGYRHYLESSNPPKSRLSSTNSTDSSVDSDGGSGVNYQLLNQSLPSMAWTKLTSFLPFIQSQRVSPTPQEESSRPASVASSSDGFPFNYAARDSKREVLNELLRKVPQSPSGANTVSVTDTSGNGIRRSSTANSGSTRSSHERSRTWGSPSDFSVPQAERRKISNVPKCVNTPGLSAHLRVQPCLPASEDSDCLWTPERAFDVFVHPSSLPEIFLSLEDKTSAILVDLVPIESPSKPPQSRGGMEDQGRSGQDSDYEIKRVTPIIEKQPVGGSEREQKGLPASVVVRLFFATKVWRRDNKMMALLSDNLDIKNDEIAIEMGHVLVSDLVRHQLGIAMCSRVILNQVKDEWRISYKQAPSLHIQPLDPPTQVSSEKPVLQGMANENEFCELETERGETERGDFERNDHFGGEDVHRGYLGHTSRQQTDHRATTEPR